MIYEVKNEHLKYRVDIVKHEGGSIMLWAYLSSEYLLRVSVIKIEAKYRTIQKECFFDCIEVGKGLIVSRKTAIS